MEATEIKPSKEARQLFNQMVARADDNLLLNLESVLKLAIDRIDKKDTDGSLMAELINEEWVEPAKGGGWSLKIYHP